MAQASDVDVALDAMEATEVLPAHMPLQTQNAVTNFCRQLATTGASTFPTHPAAMLPCNPPCNPRCSRATLRDPPYLPP